MKTVDMLLKDIKPYENNPRFNDNAVDAVAKSIQEFGFQQPLVLDKDNVIIVGHTRFKASQKLGLEKVPCVIADNLTEEQCRAYRLVDNKVGELAEWNMDLLEIEMDAIEGFDMEMFGFDTLIEEEEETQEVVEDEFKAELNEEPKAKHGDIYQLGRHRLMCGDSTSITDVRKLMDGKKADLVFTDPPYGMKKENDGVANDNLNYDDLLEFNRQWIPLTFDALKDTGGWYCWGIDEPLMDIYSEILKPMKRKNQIVIRNYITWAKHSAFGINSELMLSYPRETEKCWFVMKGQDWNNNNAEFFNTKFERILEYMQGEAKRLGIESKDVTRVTGVQMYSHWFTKSQFSIISEKHYKSLQEAYPDGFQKSYEDLRKMLGDSNNPTDRLKPYFNNIALEKVGDIGLTDVWRFTTTSGAEKESAGGHATPKPLALCSRAINASTKPNEVVLDVFGGSGSTMIACEQLNRSCYTMELEPKWVDVIIARWEQFTGEKAVLINGNNENIEATA